MIIRTAFGLSHFSTWVNLEPRPWTVYLRGAIFLSRRWRTTATLRGGAMRRDHPENSIRELCNRARLQPYRKKQLKTIVVTSQRPEVSRCRMALAEAGIRLLHRLRANDSPAHLKDRGRTES